jgi:predicted MFS family arabinose efflux permease
MALGMSGAPVIVLLGGIIGTSLAPHPSWATLPVAMLVVGGAHFTVPAAMMMEKIGRRPGFMIASFVASLATLGGMTAIARGSFSLFCLSALFIGANMAFVQQYRFAAAESVAQSEVGKAVSAVLLGGIAAAFLGPELAKISKDFLPYGLYSGSFAVLSALYAVNGGLLYFLREPGPRKKRPEGQGGGALGRVVREPRYLIAVMAGMVAYGVMSFIMTATPVSMHLIDRFSLDDTALVIQSHIVAMFLPSLFTGALIGRFGLSKIMLTGTFLMGFCAAISFVDRHFIHYWAGLVLLGVGWNFLFVGGTTLLTRTYEARDRFKAQALNDVTVFGFQAIASLSAGTVIFTSGWEVLNGLSLPLLAITAVVLLKMRKPVDR